MARDMWHSAFRLRRSHTVVECPSELCLFCVKRGATIWLTGLSASGKSTTATLLEHRLRERNISCRVFDGDVLRQAIPAPLGFSREDRAIAVRHAGRLAHEFASTPAISIVALISPYRDERLKVREIHEEAGLHFVEVFMDTPLETCIERDPKGLYRRALNGEIDHFTGLDDPYEAPLNPEVSLHSSDDANENIAALIGFLEAAQVIDALP